VPIGIDGLQNKTFVPKGVVDNTNTQNWEMSGKASKLTLKQQSLRVSDTLCGRYFTGF